MRAALAVEKARLYRIAQHAIKLRDDVLSVVAHDLRNPLGTILLQAGLLRRRQAEGERRTTKPAEVIERAATRMNHLIQDLLDVARMEGGRLTIERSPSPRRAGRSPTPFRRRSRWRRRRRWSCGWTSRRSCPSCGPTATASCRCSRT